MFGGYEVIMRSFSKLDDTPYALSLPTQTFLAGGIGANFFWLGALPGRSSLHFIFPLPSESRHSLRPFGSCDSR